jgi:hypothetical protein
VTATAPQVFRTPRQWCSGNINDFQTLAGVNHYPRVRFAAGAQYFLSQEFVLNGPDYGYFDPGQKLSLFFQNLAFLSKSETKFYNSEDTRGSTFAYLLSPCCRSPFLHQFPLFKTPKTIPRLPVFKPQTFFI